jgi:hypothetical protein
VKSSLSSCLSCRRCAVATGVHLVNPRGCEFARSSNGYSVFTSILFLSNLHIKQSKYSDKGDFMGRIWGYPDMGLGEPFISVFLAITTR